MGQPMRVGIRDNRYPRITDTKAFESAFDDINWRSKAAPSKPGRTQIVYKDGRRIVTVEGGQVVNRVELHSNHVFLGLSVYDALTQQQPAIDITPTTTQDVTEAARFAHLAKDRPR